MKIAIIGGGFAGRSAAKKLAKSLANQPDVEIVLIDKNEFTTMHPSLPDLAGGRVDENDLIENIVKLIPSNVKFMKRLIEQVNFNEKMIYFADGSNYVYDYLIFSPGSKTNFYGNERLPKTTYKMDCLGDAKHIHEAAKAFIQSHDEINIVVSGAGFTGIELATNLYHLSHDMGKKPKVSLVEVTNKVLPMLSNDMSLHVKKTMEKLGIEFLLEREVVGYDNDTVTFKDGSSIQNAFYCWCAGVMNAIPVSGAHQEIRDKRILVDAFLRIPEHPEVFVAGDAAAFKDDKGNCIRRAVNFAATQGTTAGENVLRSIQQQPLNPYKIVDLGWIIPLYINSIGEALGIPVKGRIGIPMHYLICGVKNYNPKNFFHYLGYAVKFFFTQARN